MSSQRRGLRPTCLQEVSSPAPVSARRCGSSPDLSSESVFARPCVFPTTRVFTRPVSRRVFARPRVFATTRVLARPVFWTCLRRPTCLRDGACLRPTRLRQLSSRAHMASLPEVPWQGQCAREVSSDAHVSSLREVSSPRMCFQTPTWLRCLRLACI